MCPGFRCILTEMFAQALLLLSATFPLFPNNFGLVPVVQMADPTLLSVAT